jgi:hypothetical protein
MINSDEDKKIIPNTEFYFNFSENKIHPHKKIHVHPLFQFTSFHFFSKGVAIAATLHEVNLVINGCVYIV